MEKYRSYRNRFYRMQYSWKEEIKIEIHYTELFSIIEVSDITT